ncbi:MAG: type II toxin-antitoxin system PemK/MazF family toxin [Bacillota bacterium]|nr:type II toxin-antitoxin system PemK/MazF family toxin [Bacillota bacterium]
MTNIFQPGDIVWISLDPSAGHEQKGSRPVLVVWGRKALEKMPGMSQVCAITNTDNGFPFHLSLEGNCKSTTGFVMCEQNRVLDLAARNAEFKDHISDELLFEVRSALKAMLE